VHLHCLAVYQISGQSDNVFALHDFCCLTKRRKNQKIEMARKKNEETQAIFEDSYLGNALHDLAEIWNVR